MTRPKRQAKVACPRRRLHDEGRVVAMASDGVNAASALAQIGIAMGTGTW